MSSRNGHGSAGLSGASALIVNQVNQLRRELDDCRRTWEMHETGLYEVINRLKDDNHRLRHELKRHERKAKTQQTKTD